MVTITEIARAMHNEDVSRLWGCPVSQECLTKEWRSASADAIASAMARAESLWQRISANRQFEEAAAHKDAYDVPWRCTNCGANSYDLTSSISSWRWTGKVWEHKCEGLVPQAGHMPCERV